MKYINGCCWTNLDNYNCSVVKKFAAMPKEGDRVVVKYKGIESSLKVCSIKHDERLDMPFIHVELNK